MYKIKLILNILQPVKKNHSIKPGKERWQHTKVSK